MSATVSIDRGVGRTLLGACVPCCSFAPPPPTPTVQVECRSWTSSEATAVCGFAGFPDSTWDDMNPTSWAGYARRWRTMTHDGELVSPVFTGSTVCAGTPAVTFRQIWSGVSTLDCSGLDNNFTIEFCTPTCDGGNINAITTQPPVDCPTAAAFYAHSRAFALTVMTDTGCGCLAGGSDSIETTGTRTITLTNEVDAAEEIFNSDGVEGTDCCAVTASTSDLSSSPQNNEPLTYASGSTAVELTVSGTGVPETEYKVTLYFIDEDDNETSREFLVTTDDGSTRDPLDGLGEFEFTFNIPQPNRPNGELCFDRAEIELPEEP